MPSNLPNLRYILSIDIGLHHLGLIGAVIQPAPGSKLINIDLCELIDIKGLSEFCVFGKDCTLHHSLCIADYMAHFFKLYETKLDEAEIILIEQQPPMGLIAVQELIVFQYRDKIKMISPTSVHKHFNITGSSYELRKKFTINYANRYLEEFQTYKNMTRKHDVGDAVCILLYYLQTSRRAVTSKYFRSSSS